MKHQILYVLLLAIGIGQSAPAQTDTSGAAFAMTRATVKFLATDTDKFGRNMTPCEPCATYKDLNQYVKQNRLLGADRLIIDVQKRVDTSSPTELQAYLLKRVAEGGRKYRQKLPGFLAYQQELSVLADGVSDRSDAGRPIVGNPSVAPSSGTDRPSDVSDTSASQRSAGTDRFNSTVNTQPSMLTWLSLVLSLLSLAGVIILFFRQKSNRPSSATDLNIDVTDATSRRIDKLENIHSNLVNQVMTLQKSVQQANSAPYSRDQLQSVQPTLTPLSTPTPPPITSPVQESIVQSVAPVAPPVPAVPQGNTFRSPSPTAPTLLYGRTADLGDGFSVSGLSAKPDRDTIFEISITDSSRAQFKVSENSDLQRLALSDVYSYLSDTCIYATQPRDGGHIRNERPGALSLQGNKWLIVEKAQISFQ